MSEAVYWGAGLAIFVAVGVLLANALLAFLAPNASRLTVALWLGLSVVCYGAIYAGFITGWVTIGVRWLRHLAPT